MHIGFEAKRAFCNSTGLGNYGRTLINSFEEFFPEAQMTLFTPKKAIEFNPHANIVLPTRILSKLNTSYWRSKGIVNDIDQYKLDAFHGMSHEIPIGMQKKVRSIVTMHDLIYLTRPNEFKWFDRMSYDRKFRYAANNAHAVVAITNETKKDLIKYFKTPEDKIHVIYQSCDDVFTKLCTKQELVSFKVENNLPEDFILFVGSMNPRKKPFELVKAFHQIQNKTDWSLRLVGRGSERAKIESYIKENSLDSRVEIIDVKNSHNLAKLYQAAKLFAFPSVYEGFGIPIIEAMNSQTCVLTSPFSCLPEVAGPDAFYANPDDITEFSNKLLQIIDNPQLREQSIIKNSEWVKRFSRKKIAKQYMEVFKG